MWIVAVAVVAGFFYAGCGGQTVDAHRIGTPGDAGLGGSPVVLPESGLPVESGPPATSTGGAPPRADAGSPPASPTRRCQTDADCDRREKCVSEGSAQVFVCRTRCTVLADGGGVGCGPGEVCNNGETCARVCTPFLDPTDCGDGDWCQPPSLGGFSHVPARLGLCTSSANDLVEGEACLDFCGPNMDCSTSGLIGTIGTAHCGRLCDATQSYPNSGCPRGKCEVTFQGQTLSHCVEDCDPFGANTCAEGSSCFPFDELLTMPLSRILHGKCIRPGHVQEGMPCEPRAVGGEACAAGLACTSPPGPFATAATCLRYCNVKDTDGCKADETCVPFFSYGYIDLGICQRTCKLWQTDPGAAGCAVGEFCSPRYTVEGAGICARPGLSPTGGDCKVDADCAAGTMCRCRFDFSARTQAYICEYGHCERMCAPGSKAGEPGSCPDGGVCFVAEFQNSPPVPSEVGVCRDSCDFDAKKPCPRPDQECAPRELTGDPSDSCIDATQPGFECYQKICGPLRMCLQNFSGCMPVCRIDAGPIDSKNHPDCPDPAMTCTRLIEAQEYGVCI